MSPSYPSLCGENIVEIYDCFKPCDGSKCSGFSVKRKPSVCKNVVRLIKISALKIILFHLIFLQLTKICYGVVRFQEILFNRIDLNKNFNKSVLKSIVGLKERVVHFRPLVCHQKDSTLNFFISLTLPLFSSSCFTHPYIVIRTFSRGQKIVLLSRKYHLFIVFFYALKYLFKTERNEKGKTYSESHLTRMYYTILVAYLYRNLIKVRVFEAPLARKGLKENRKVLIYLFMNVYKGQTLHL